MEWKMRRVWYQSMIVLSDLEDYKTTLQRRLSSYGSDELQIDIHGFARGSFPANYPGPDLNYSVFYQLHSLQFLLAAVEAERRGYDAYVMGNIGSPMVREIRSIVDIPVVGYGDAAARLAGFYGQSFGILVFNVERIESAARRYEDWQLSGFGGVCPAGVRFDDVANAHANIEARPSVVAKVIATAEEFVKRNNIDVLIPGEMPLNLLLADEGISKIGGATVIDGLAAMMQMASVLMDLKESSGMSHSRRGYYNQRPPELRTSELIDFYGLRKLSDAIYEQK